jgi:hypothetical protein
VITGAVGSSAGAARAAPFGAAPASRSRP